MTTTTWTGSSGNFNTASNWSAGVPTAGVDAFINGSVTAPLTVSFTAGTDTANSLTTTDTTFAMSGGSLTLAATSSFAQAVAGQAAVTESAGLIDFQNGGAANDTSTINGATAGITQTGGTIAVDAGLLQIYGSSGFAGTISGAGAVAVRGSGTFDLNLHSALTVATLEVGDTATLQLNTAVTYAGSFIDQENGSATTLNLNGHGLVLKGSAAFSNNFGVNDLVTGGGTLELTGASTLSSTVVGGAVAVVNTGTLSEFGGLQIGDAGTDIVTVSNSGTWELNTGDTMGVGANAASSFTNTGLFEMAGGAGSATVVPQFTNATGGTVSAASGDLLQFYGNSSSDGTISGAGGVAVRGSSVFTYMGGTVSVGSFDIYDSGTLDLAANLSYAGTFAEQGGGGALATLLGGHTLTLSGPAFFSDNFGINAGIVGPGTLDLAGSTQISAAYLGGGAALSNSGTVSQTGYFQLGDGNTDIVSATNSGTWILDPGQTLGVGANSSEVFANTGTFEVTSTGGTATVNAQFSNAAGATVSVATNSLLQFYGTASMGGSITGGGGIAIRGGSIFTVEPGLSATIGSIALDDSATLQLAAALTYAGTFFMQEGGSVPQIQLNGQTLTLSGNSFFSNGFGNNNFIGSSGVLANSGTMSLSSVILGGTALMTNAGLVNQTGYFQIGDGSGSIAGAANSGTWDLSAPVTIGTGTNSASTFTNSGLFEMTSTAGASNVDALFTSTGTIDAANAGSVIDFNDGGTISGTIIGGGTVNFQNGHTYDVTTKIAVSVANLALLGSGTTITELISEPGYGGNFTIGGGATLTINSGIKFALTGTANLDGVVNGGGTFIASGASAVVDIQGLVLGGSATLLDQGGTLAENQNWTIGDSASSTAKLEVAARSIYEITGDSGILSDGVGAITNSGTFEKLAGTGTSVIDPLLTNGGKVIANSGTLEFQQGVTNDALAAAENGNTLIFASSVVTGTGQHGTLELLNGANMVFGGFVDQGETLDFADGSISQATLDNPGSFSATILGFQGSNALDLKGVSGATAAYAGNTTSGTLTLTETIGGNPVVVAHLDFSGDFTLASFKIGGDGSGGTLVQLTGAAAAPPVGAAEAAVPMAMDQAGGLGFGLLAHAPVM